MVKIEVKVFYKGTDGNNKTQSFYREFRDPDEAILNIFKMGLKFMSNNEFVFIPPHMIEKVTYEIVD